jgi:hypothetical protein
MLLVQLGINSTSDVWKFCQNWTSRRGESNLANFQTSRVFIISMTKLDSYVLLNVNIIFSRQSPVLLNFQPKFGAFVRIFI